MKVTVFHKPRPEAQSQRVGLVSHAGRKLDLLLLLDGSYVVREKVTKDTARLIGLAGSYAAALRVAQRDLLRGA